MEELLDAARKRLPVVRKALESQGLRYVELRDFVMGAGVALGFGDTQFVVVSINNGDATSVYVTSGVLRDVNREALPVLEACNRRNQNNPSFPLFLHDADIGWDVLLQQRYPLGLVIDVPEFIALNIRAIPGVVGEIRQQLAADPRVGGVPYRWSDEDAQRLLICSLV